MIAGHARAAGAWRPPDAEVEAIAAGKHPDPFAVLGRHRDAGGNVSVRVFAPTADRVEVIGVDGDVIAELERLHKDGFFAGPIAGGEEAYGYRLRHHRDGHSWEAEDPYRFPPILGDIDVHLFAEGSHQRIFEKLGAHPGQVDGVEGTSFTVWAPNAKRVSVVGTFNEWDGRRHPMRKRHDIGVFELFIPGVEKSALYKFEILGPKGELLPLKADPVSFCQEAPPATSSVVHGLVRWDWEDAEWMARRDAVQDRSAPISVYEVHLGSWRRGEDNRYLSYDEIADQLIPYVLDMGFTHIELLPISEHPFSGSWGYQPIGLFAPTSRFGSPETFARLIGRCHSAGVGVIIDWVPAHFPTDEHGLAHFDGTALYEHEDPRLGHHQDWDTLIYNFGRNEVANFLESNALYWLEQFHIDGLRVDAVASMLYRDYSRKPGEWLPNIHGGNENLEAIDFLRGVNRRVAENHPGAMTVAEESTSWPMVSGRVEVGGLGFDFKWNMGWMHDTLDYMRRDPIHRRFHHNQLTFGLLYAFSENFVLPLSHDEVVHGKGSLLGKMPGDRWRKFANLRAYFGFMWTHPGKKLLFMGGEFAQEREWNHDRALDWNVLQDGFHRGVQALVKDLNNLYRTTPALHEKDCQSDGFEWVDASDTDQSVVCFLRRGTLPSARVLVVCNFTPEVRRGYRVGVPDGGRWIERLNSDASIYGGSNIGNGGACVADEVPCHGRPHSLSLSLPPLATLVFEQSTT